MSGKVRWTLLFGLVMLHFRFSLTDEVTCSRIDFDQATVTYLARCSFYQEFESKPYAESAHFQPFRKDAKYYLTNQWEGLTCGETVESFSLNEETELRMIYNLILDSGATLEVRVVDLDRLDSENKPTVVIRWKTEQATLGWGLFREKMDKTVKRAKIQIEANMNAGSDVAIEYFTIFNFEVETDECNSIDEFAPTTTTSTPLQTITTTTTVTTTTTTPATTTTTLSSSTSTTSTEVPTTTTEFSTLETSSTVGMSTAYTQRDESTTTSTEVPTTTTTVSSTIAESSTTEIFPEIEPNSNEWVWIMLAALFACLLCIATASAAYIYAMNKHLLDLNTKLREHRLRRDHSGLDLSLRKVEEGGKRKIRAV
ncbi:uncharacterized protein LOC109411670 [Aedes albopictus]|uniref:Uncharacterized protein n=1 Tax=Aedes albopictus TaxID=7160 RepID=A0ABM1ZAE3_AEDAL